MADTKKSAVTIDPLTLFAEFAELKAEYATLKPLLSMLTSYATFINVRDDNEELLKAINYALEAVKKRAFAIGDWMGGADKRIAIMVELIKSIPQTEVKQ